MEDAFHVLHSLMAICTYMIDLYAADDHVVQVVLLGPVNSHLPGMIGHPASANWNGAMHNMDVNMSLVTLLLVIIYIGSIYTKHAKPPSNQSHREQYPYIPHAKDTHVPTWHANHHGDRVEVVWTL